MSDCDAWEAATLRRELPHDEPIWDGTPTDTHVSTEFVDDPVARAFIESRYEIGERCPRPFAPPSFHAHLRTEEPA